MQIDLCEPRLRSLFGTPPARVEADAEGAQESSDVPL
jgi:hypothetical protein